MFQGRAFHECFRVECFINVGEAHVVQGLGFRGGQGTCGSRFRVSGLGVGKAHVVWILMVWILGICGFVF
jgi:hypothetical protein